LCVPVTWIIYYLLFCADRVKISVWEFIAWSGRISTEYHCQAIKICNIPIQYLAYVQCTYHDVCASAQKYVWNTMISPSGIRLSLRCRISLYIRVKYMCCRKKSTTTTQKRQVYCTKGVTFFIFSHYLFEYLIYCNFDENNNRLWFMNYNICVHNVWNCRRICNSDNISVGSIIIRYKLKFVNFMKHRNNLQAINMWLMPLFVEVPVY